MTDFYTRHVGTGDAETKHLLATTGYDDLKKFIDAVIPANLPRAGELGFDAPLSEAEMLKTLDSMLRLNSRAKNYIGLGYSPVYTPSVIRRNVLEDPRWYSAYTPYQAELSQGRLEALLNFQQMVIDLTGLPIANASLLDESSALAEAMNMAFNFHRRRRHKFFVSEQLYPQTLAVLATRAAPLGIELVIGGTEMIPDTSFFGGAIQYPHADGEIPDLSEFCQRLHAVEALAITSADITSLLLLPPPAACGADIAVGSTQRFGMPLYYGGPHAAYIACQNTYLRSLPGRVVGVSKDSRGHRALRMALQTREQHIRREKASSNICTAQVLPAVIASFYAVYQGRERLVAAAKELQLKTAVLRTALVQLGYSITNKSFFDTLTVAVDGSKRSNIISRAAIRGINFRIDRDNYIGIALNELTSMEDIADIVVTFEKDRGRVLDWAQLEKEAKTSIKAMPTRSDTFLTHSVFNTYQTETEFLRYVSRLSYLDLSLVHAMIPLGSCTMKLNSTSSLLPLSLPAITDIHPFAPAQQTAGYQRLIDELEDMLATICGMHAVSLQPNAGSQGELAGLLAIRNYHRANGDNNRNVCLIPSSAHGTNPASATMAGFKVVELRCGDDGSISMDDLHAQATKHRNNIAALMITYPSTHGVFDDNIREVCKAIHNYGGQVYLDGANMNAMVGLVKPSDLGADVMHLNLHKTFCIPHGGGGPGVGPIAVQEHLAPFLPSHPYLRPDADFATTNAITSAPYGSAGILAISWAYIKLMGAKGLQDASVRAILHANYIAKRLEKHYCILYTSKLGLVAHECIIDCRPFRRQGIGVNEIARRLMDYSFHSPTISWPIAHTMMIEPTESESLAELDRFCEAMIAIKTEIDAITADTATDSVVANAPHTVADLMAADWQRQYSKEQAFYPLSQLHNRKFWVPVNKIDHAYGDRCFVCGL
ncbi:MAG: aminomethyl-transferring glycine dehydrogenase [Pseudomonadota bacterium]|nr:aminomethyl-transferring glycine dehydrogenase [Pseudomonadota bacterium]